MIKAIINPIIVPMSSYNETMIPHDKTTRAEQLEHLEEHHPKPKHPILLTPEVSGGIQTDV